MLLSVTVALAASILITGRVLMARADTHATVEVEHEARKFQQFATQATDPDTGLPFASVDDLLSQFLQHNLPDSDETFFSVVDGRAHKRSAATPLARLDQDPAIIAAAAAADHQVSVRLETPAGPARYAVFPITIAGAPEQGALVVVEFLAPNRDEAWSVIRLLLVTSALALALSGMVSWLVAGQVLAPIRQVRETAKQIGRTDLSRRIDVSGTGEVTELATTFNEMLDRVESAFDQQRQFLDDVGHELRTPLTVVRGYLELDDDDPADRERSQALVLDEVARMTRMVDDLTVLASAERPDFLRPREVDVTDLVVEVAAKAAKLADRRWHVDQVTVATVIGDPDRLTQALMQLAANAVKHTTTGSGIGFGAATPVPGRVRLWVRDSGDGVPVEDRERIFERFERSEPADTGGAGLGLAIVSTIASAHGGTIGVEDSVGGGATFVLDLPRADEDDDTAALDDLLDTPDGPADPDGPDGPAGPHGPDSPDRHGRLDLGAESNPRLEDSAPQPSITIVETKEQKPLYMRPTDAAGQDERGIEAR